jgi:hypothetical protein
LDKIAAILLITLLAIVFAVSMSYYVLSQSNQTQNNSSPIPTPTPEATPTPTSTPTPSPSETPTETAAIPKPYAPEFTLQLVDDSLGLQIEIQDQPIIDNGEDTANIFYNIRIKDHDSTDWHYTTVPDPSHGIRGYFMQTGVTGVTRLVSPVEGIKESIGRNDSFQVDYQIEAINGYLGTGLTSGGIPPIGFDPNSTPVIIVNTSGWSEIQTITIP